MHRAFVNQCDITVTLIPQGPLTSLDDRYTKKDGVASITKKDHHGKVVTEKVNNSSDFPNNIPVSRNSAEAVIALLQAPQPSLLERLNTLDFYLPGASVRGMLRSHAERNFRALSPEDSPVCCDPFQTEMQVMDCSCGKFWEKCSNSSYTQHCPVCRLFGSTKLAGRLRIGDFTISRRGHVVLRDSVPLDRFSQKVVHGPFRSALLDDYRFTGKLTLHNFECRQLGLMGYLLRDLCFAQLALGWGKNKGYGKLTGTVDGVELVYYGAYSGEESPIHLKGIEHCGYLEQDPPHPEGMSLPPGTLLSDTSQQLPFRRVFHVASPTMEPDSPFWTAVMECFNETLPSCTALSRLRS